jgi:hypothetical protein
MHHRLGDEFPHEGFVQRALERHFANCSISAAGTADYACIDERTGERWIIEAKGKTSQVGLDFRTGIGQLVQGMTEQGWRYGLAVPDTPQFVAQMQRVQPWVRDALGLSWLIVSEDGSIRVEAPTRR